MERKQETCKNGWEGTKETSWQRMMRVKYVKHIYRLGLIIFVRIAERQMLKVSVDVNVLSFQVKLKNKNL